MDAVLNRLDAALGKALGTAGDRALVVLLPAKPNNSNDDTRGHSGYSPTQTTKIAVIADRWLTVGSANLNEHSLFNDTEVNVFTHDAQLARGVRLRLWSEHLGMAEG